MKSKKTTKRTNNSRRSSNIDDVDDNDETVVVDNSNKKTKKNARKRSRPIATSSPINDVASSTSQVQKSVEKPNVSISARATQTKNSNGSFVGAEPSTSAGSGNQKSTQQNVSNDLDESSGDSCDEKREKINIPASDESDIDFDDDENENTVKMPHSQKNWNTIKTSLMQKWNTLEDFRAMICTYNPRFAEISPSDMVYCVSIILLRRSVACFPIIRDVITELALDISKNMAQDPIIKILTTKKSSFLKFTRGQIASILANAFLCTFPENAGVSSINFWKLFEVSGFRSSDNTSHPIIGEKLECILRYFLCIKREEENLKDEVRFYRIKRCTANNGTWKFTAADLSFFGLFSSSFFVGSISFENDVFTYGKTGREMIYWIYPELLILRMFAEPLEDDEAFYVIGAQQYSTYFSLDDKPSYVENMVKKAQNIVLFK